MTNTPSIGDKAPDFTLRDQNNQEVMLSQFQGEKAVLLVFYPFAFSGICTGELCALRDDLARINNDHVQLLTVSVDSVFVHKTWAERDKFDFPLLSDFWPHGAVAQQYGIFNDNKGVAKRASFLIGKDGTIAWSAVNAVPDARDEQQYIEALTALTTT